MNITFLKLYTTKELNSAFYNSQELGMAKALVEVYPEHNVNVVLLTYRKSTGTKELKKEHINNKITLYIVPTFSIGHHGIMKLDILKELQTDLVHLLADNMIYAPNVIRYCRREKIKIHLYIGTIISDNSRIYRQFVSRFLMQRNIRAYRKCDVYVKTPAVMKQCEEYGIRAKLAPVGLDKNTTIISEKSGKEIRKELSLPLDKKLLLFVGRFEEYKRPLDAIELISGLGREYILVMVGEGVLSEKIDRKAEEQGVKDRIIRFKRVQNARMREFYKACDFFVNFNRVEIYGMSILEAMCHECVVLAMHAPGPDFIVKDGETGFLCRTIDDVAFKIDHLSNNPEIAKKIAQGARQYVLQNLMWENTVKAFDDFRINEG